MVARYPWYLSWLLAFLECPPLGSYYSRHIWECLRAKRVSSSFFQQCYLLRSIYWWGLPLNASSPAKVPLSVLGFLIFFFKKYTQSALTARHQIVILEGKKKKVPFATQIWYMPSLLFWIWASQTPTRNGLCNHGRKSYSPTVKAIQES